MSHLSLTDELEVLVLPEDRGCVGPKGPPATPQPPSLRTLVVQATL